MPRLVNGQTRMPLIKSIIYIIKGGLRRERELYQWKVTIRLAAMVTAMAMPPNISENQAPHLIQPLTRV